MRVARDSRGIARQHRSPPRGESEIVRGPVLVSGSRSSFAPRSTSFPAQVQDLALAAPGQQQEADRRNRVGPIRPLRVSVASSQHPARAAGTRPSVRNRSRACARGTSTTSRHGLLASGIRPLVLRRVVDARQARRRHLVRRHRLLAQPVVQLRHLHMARPPSAGFFPNPGTNVLLDHQSGRTRTPSSALTAHRDMLVEPVAARCSPTVGPSSELHRHRLGHRVLARLDARDDECRAPPRLFRA